MADEYILNNGTSIGSSASDALHVVLPSERFKDLGNLVDRTREILEMCDVNKRHVILYPETPFSFDKFFSRREVKEAVGKISALLAKHGSKSHVVFSVNESLKRVYAPTFDTSGESLLFTMNNGYVISSAKKGNSVYKVAPKFLQAKGEKSAQFTFKRSRSRTVYDLERAQQEHVKKREELFNEVISKRKNSKSGALFSRVKLSKEHTIEVKVCRDVVLPVSKSEKNTITLVPAGGIDEPDFIAKLAKHRAAVIINDVHREHWRRVQIGDALYSPDLKGRVTNRGNVNAALDAKKIRIHFI